MAPTLKTITREVSWGKTRDVVMITKDGGYFNLSLSDRFIGAPPDSNHSAIKQKVEQAATALGITDPEEIRRMKQELIDGEREITW